MKKSIQVMAIFALIVLIQGCAITSGHHSGPNGRPVHFIDGMSASVAYQKAGELCPSGYTLIGEPRQVSIMDYVMTIECKGTSTAARSAAPQQPSAVVTQMAAVPAVSKQSGEMSYEVEKLARQSGCQPAASAALIAKTTGVETYQVSCQDGQQALVKCEVRQCRVMN